MRLKAVGEVEYEHEAEVEEQKDRPKNAGGEWCSHSGGDFKKDAGQGPASRRKED